MNERIKELSLQASDSIPDDVSAEHAMYLFQKKFAELIVKECARIARATPAPYFDAQLKEQLGHTWDMAAIEAGREIIKYFGVEKCVDKTAKRGHEDWCASLTQLLLSNPPQPAPCNCKSPKREWVGLTDGETVDLLNDYEGRLWTDIVPAIEAKLKEKNGG